MIYLLFGDLKYQNKIDILKLPLKYLYMVYTLPTLVFIFLLGMRGAGALGVPEKNGIGIVKLLLFRFSVFVLSFGLWIGIYGIIVRYSGT